MSLRPGSVMQVIVVPTRPRRWWPDHVRRSVRPSRAMARRASVLAPAPGLSFFHGPALRRGGMIASAPRPAMASRQARPSQAPSAVTGATGASAGTRDGRPGGMGAASVLRRRRCRPPGPRASPRRCQGGPCAGRPAGRPARRAARPRPAPPCLRAPFALAARLDARAVDRKVTRPARSQTGQLRGERPPASAGRPRSPAPASPGQSGPVRAREPRQARRDAGRLPRRHRRSDRWRDDGNQPEEDLDRQARLHRGVGDGLLPAAPAPRRRMPGQARVGPDRRRPAPAQRRVVGRPVQGAVASGRLLEPAIQPGRRTRDADPEKPACNEAGSRRHLPSEAALSVFQATCVELSCRARFGTMRRPLTQSSKSKAKPWKLPSTGRRPRCK